MLARVG
jgi:hypothetical protein